MGKVTVVEGIHIIECSLNDNIMFCCMFEHGVQCYYTKDEAVSVITRHLKSDPCLNVKIINIV